MRLLGIIGFIWIGVMTGANYWLLLIMYRHFQHGDDSITDRRGIDGKLPEERSPSLRSGARDIVL